MRIGIDASRNRSGGAIAHLIGIISECAPNKHGIESIVVWAYRALLDKLPDHPWLIKRNPAALEGPLFQQMAWQATQLSAEAKDCGCDILFSSDASTLCRFNPMVVLSQDMLSYEPGVMRYFGFGLARLRLLAILALQNMAFRRANGVIFLTSYAQEVIQKSCGSLRSTTVIPHGVGEAFREVVPKLDRGFAADKESIECIYVSNTELYKHQWVVVEAISLLRSRGHKVNLCLIGGGEGRAQELLMNSIATADPHGMFIKQEPFLPHSALPQKIANSDVFIFASSCENMPVTLVEGMAAGLPIACSNRGPMPEVLSDGGLYFDPENANSIALAVEEIILSPTKRRDIAAQAKKISLNYNWKRCADETFAFIAETYSRTQK